MEIEHVKPVGCKTYTMKMEVFIAPDSYMKKEKCLKDLMMNFEELEK